MPTTLTQGSPWRAILAFSIPLVLGNMVQQVYQLADTAVVGRFVGVLPLAAVGATGVLLWLITGFSWGMTAGLAIPIAQAYGAKDEAAVRRSVGVGAWISLGLTVILTLIGTVLIRPLLTLLRTPAELMDDAATFGFISFLFMAAVIAFNYLSAILRAVGDSRTPLYFLAVSAALNIVLDLALIGGLHMGVAGAGFATATAQTVSALLCLWWIGKRFPIFHLSRDDWRVTREQLRHHLGLGVPLGFQASITALGGVAVQVRLNTLGSESVAAFTTASRVDGLAVTFLIGMEVTVSTYVAQNWGARDLARVRAGVSQAFRMVVTEAVILGVLLVLANRPLVHLFIGDADPTVVDLSAHAVELWALTYWILGVLFVARGALQGLGRMRAPFWSGVVELVLRVLAAVWLGGIIGFMGVAAASPLAWAGAVALLLPSYLRVRARLLDDDALAAAQARPLPEVLRRPRLPGRGRARRGGRAGRGQRARRPDG